MATARFSLVSGARYGQCKLCPKGLRINHHRFTQQSDWSPLGQVVLAISVKSMLVSQKQIFGICCYSLHRKGCFLQNLLSCTAPPCSANELAIITMPLVWVKVSAKMAPAPEQMLWLSKELPETVAFTASLSSKTENASRRGKCIGSHNWSYLILSQRKELKCNTQCLNMSPACVDMFHATTHDTKR